MRCRPYDWNGDRSKLLVANELPYGRLTYAEELCRLF